MQVMAWCMKFCSHLIKNDTMNALMPTDQLQRIPRHFSIIQTSELVPHTLQKIDLLRLATLLPSLAGFVDLFSNLEQHIVHLPLLLASQDSFFAV